MSIQYVPDPTIPPSLQRERRRSPGINGTLSPAEFGGAALVVVGESPEYLG